ncbi:MAG: hypothetical protein F6K19_08295 [Cyanothece sp. SIO1E1]|nr:hypothetical protein [Cyanothece sp. SIO1E1]
MKRLIFYALCGGMFTAGLVGNFNGLFEPNLTSTQVQAQEQPGSFDLAPMTVERLDSILTQQTDNLNRQGTQWQFNFQGRSMLVAVSEEHNRMRIVAPITEVQNLTGDQVQSMMVANFHTALDGRYAVTNGLAVATFLHPLASLQENDFLSALSQVEQLATNFGTTYSSGGLNFIPGGGAQQQPDSTVGDFEI